MKGTLGFIHSRISAVDEARRSSKPTFAVLSKFKGQVLLNAGVKKDLFFPAPAYLSGNTFVQTPLKFGFSHLAGRGARESLLDRDMRSFVGKVSSYLVPLPIILGPLKGVSFGFSQIRVPEDLRHAGIFSLNSLSALNFGYKSFDLPRLLSSANYVVPLYNKRRGKIRRKRGYHVLVAGLRFFLKRFYFFVVPRKFRWIRRFFNIFFVRFFSFFILLKSSDTTAFSPKYLFKLFKLLHFCKRTLVRSLRIMTVDFQDAGFRRGKISFNLLNLNLLLLKIIKDSMRDVLASLGEFRFFLYAVQEEKLGISFSNSLSFLRRVSILVYNSRELFGIHKLNRFGVGKESRILRLYSSVLRHTNKRLFGLTPFSQSKTLLNVFLNHTRFYQLRFLGFQFSPFLLENDFFSMSIVSRKRSKRIKRTGTLTRRKKAFFSTRMFTIFVDDRRIVERIKEALYRAGVKKRLLNRRRVARINRAFYRKRRGMGLVYRFHPLFWCLSRMFFFKRSTRTFFRKKPGKYTSGRDFREPLVLHSFVWLGGADRFRRMTLLSEMPMRSLRGLLPIRVDLKECSYARFLGFRPPLFSLSKIKIVSRREREERIYKKAQLALRPRKPLSRSSFKKSHVSKRNARTSWFSPLS